MNDFDLDRSWALAGSVALRPERFGALAYSFETRRLSFLKSRTLFDVVTALGGHETGRAACEAVGVDPAELPAIVSALRRLAQTGMIVAGAPAEAVA